MAISLRLGWQKDQLRPTGSGDPSATPCSMILPHRSPDSGCFALLYLKYFDLISYYLGLAMFTIHLVTIQLHQLHTNHFKTGYLKKKYIERNMCHLSFCYAIQGSMSI